MSESYYPLVRREPYLIGFWRLADASGSNDAADWGNHYDLTGVFEGSPARGPALIQADSTAASYVFGNVGKSVLVPDTSVLRMTGDLSIEAWVSPYSSQTAAIAGKTNAAGTVAAPYYLGVSSGKLTLSLGNGTTQATLTTPNALPLAPTHVAATSFRGALALYVNGALVQSGSLGAQAVADGGEGVYFGAVTSSGESPFNGLIAEVALYSGALSARRVKRHFIIGQQVLSDPAHYVTVDPPVIA